MENSIVAEKYPLIIEKTHSEMGWCKWGVKGENRGVKGWGDEVVN